jgi:hypothetical protein
MASVRKPGCVRVQKGCKGVVGCVPDDVVRLGLVCRVVRDEEEVIRAVGRGLDLVEHR